MAMSVSEKSSGQTQLQPPIHQLISNMLFHNLLSRPTAHLLDVKHSIVQDKNNMINTENEESQTESTVNDECTEESQTENTVNDECSEESKTENTVNDQSAEELKTKNTVLKWTPKRKLSKRERRK